MRFIIVDGLDGVGKDTHAQLIKKRYEEQGEKVIVRSHPQTDNIWGRTAKRALLGSGKVNRLKASIFYALDVLRSIRLYYRHPHHDTLIMVRYLMGTAYLPGRLGKLAYHLFERFVPTSEYMFFLDASPDILLERLAQRKEKEMFETYEALLKVRKKALNLAHNWHIIDTAGSIEDTFVHIENLLDKLDKDHRSS